jgi:hypothetical protein
VILAPHSSLSAFSSVDDFFNEAFLIALTLHTIIACPCIQFFSYCCSAQQKTGHHTYSRSLLTSLQALDDAENASITNSFMSKRSLEQQQENHSTSSLSM